MSLGGGGGSGTTGVCDETRRGGPRGRGLGGGFQDANETRQRLAINSDAPRENLRDRARDKNNGVCVCETFAGPGGGRWLVAKPRFKFHAAWDIDVVVRRELGWEEPPPCTAPVSASHIRRCRGFEQVCDVAVQYMSRDSLWRGRYRVAQSTSVESDKGIMRFRIACISIT